MSELKQFRLPDVGEGLTEADIIKWHVQPGDKVTINQIIVEIETAKAVVELPSPYEGVVAGLLVPEGTTADVGTPIISVEVGPDAGSGQPAESGGGEPLGREQRGAARHGGRDLRPGRRAAARPAGQHERGPGSPAPGRGGQAEPEGGIEPGIHGTLAAKEEKEERHSVLVGYGVKPGSTARRAQEGWPCSRSPVGPGHPRPRPRRPRPPPPPPRPTPRSPLCPPPPRPGPRRPSWPSRRSARWPGTWASTWPGCRAPAPAARSRGTTCRRPRAARTRPISPRTPPAAAPAVPAQFAPVTAVAREERIAIRGVRKHTAAAVTGSAFSAPHVTEFLQIDITETMNATARLRTLPEFSEVRVSPLLLVARALMVAVARHPMINSTWDEDAQEIVVRHYVNLGIAAATDRGLVVPNIKDAHALSLPGLARALADLAETARAGKTTPAGLRGGTITITNVGVFGVDTGTPILTPGEAAILAFGQVKDAPWVHEGQLAVRKVTTLALSFDHRIVDGDLGSAVLRDIGAMLEDPLRMLAWS